jgi:Zn-dependent peptidase ImmA (M78 family)/transcriptional regulator with XRE-family HTH domain
VAPRIEAIVEPDLLVWARQRAGFSVEVAARKAGIRRPEQLADWEGGSARPTVKQLRRLGRVYGRSLAMFYLPEPPRDFPPIKDYRRAWTDEQLSPSPELRAEVEWAFARREIALELFEREGSMPVQLRVRASIEENADAVARRLRLALGISTGTQFSWDGDYAGFNAWRFAIEKLGALVIQMTTVETREARGFSIADRPLPVVVASNRDPVRARSFTVIHELVHIALQEGGVCDLGDHGQIEPFCNRVAGAVLVPAEMLLSQDLVRDHSAVEWSDDELEELAELFRTSREVIVRRLLILGRTDESFYARKRRQFLAEYEARASEPRETGPVPPSTTAVIRSGRLFSRLVLSNYSHGRITPSDVSEYLGVRLKHVPRIQQLVSRPE